MAIYKQAGTTFEASTPPLTTGLVGTIGVRIMDGQGGTTTARSTPGIVETPAGSGIYVATLTAPAAGDYQVVWDTGGVTPAFGVEDLVVSTGPPTFAVPAGADLCTLADVRERRGTTADNLTQDPDITRIISGVSAAIARDYEREFTPTAATARVFELRGPDLDRVVLHPYEIRTVTQVRIDPDEDAPTVMDTADYRLAPNPAIHGTYHRLRIRPGAVTVDPAVWGGGVLIEITGDWGFAAIPLEVREAAIISVVHNMRTTVGQYSIADGAGGETRYERAEIPQAARDLLKPYKRQDMYF